MPQSPNHDHDDAARPVRLLPRQEKFCWHVALGASPTEAARRAGYSVRNARQYGSKLTTNAYICRRIREISHDRLERAEDTRIRLLAMVRELKEAAEARGALQTASRMLMLECRLSGVDPEELWTGMAAPETQHLYEGILLEQRAMDDMLPPPEPSEEEEDAEP